MVVGLCFRFPLLESFWVGSLELSKVQKSTAFCRGWFKMLQFLCGDPQKLRFPLNKDEPPILRNSEVLLFEVGFGGAQGMRNEITKLAPVWCPFFGNPQNRFIPTHVLPITPASNTSVLVRPICTLASTLYIDHLAVAQTHVPKMAPLYMEERPNLRFPRPNLRFAR